MAQINTDPLPALLVSPPHTVFHPTAQPFVPKNGKGKASTEDETRVQLVFPEPTEWKWFLNRLDKDTPVAKHLCLCQDRCQNRSSGWEKSELHKGKEQIWRLGYSPSQDCERRDRYYKLPPAIIPDYTARHFSSFVRNEDKQLVVFRQVLADIDPVIKKFHHCQAAIAETNSGDHDRKARQGAIRYHTECHFSQTQAYHGAGSISDDIEYWQIHVLDKKQWHDLQVRILEHGLIEKHRAVGGIIEDLAKMKDRNRLHTRSDAFYEEQGIEFAELVREFLLANFRGFLPDDRPALAWDATRNIRLFRYTPGSNTSILGSNPDARKAADSYDHQAKLQRGAWRL